MYVWKTVNINSRKVYAKRDENVTLFLKCTIPTQGLPKGNSLLPSIQQTNHEIYKNKNPCLIPKKLYKKCILHNGK